MRPEAWRTYNGRRDWLFEYIKARYNSERDSPTSRALSNDVGLSETYVAKMLAKDGENTKLPTVIAVASLGNVSVGWLANNEGWPNEKVRQAYEDRFVGDSRDPSVKFTWDNGKLESDAEQASAMTAVWAQRQAEIEERRANRRAAEETKQRKKSGPSPAGSRSSIRPTAAHRETDAMKAARALPRARRR